jgi:hypothetical protein
MSLPELHKLQQHLDVVITKEKKLKVRDLGLSDHYAQILSIPLSDFSKITHKIKQDSLVKLMFRNLFINQVIWQEVYTESDVNAKFSTFMDVFLYCHSNAFPIKKVYDTIKNNWITQGIKISSKNI